MAGELPRCPLQDGSGTDYLASRPLTTLLSPRAALSLTPPLVPEYDRLGWVSIQRIPIHLLPRPRMMHMRIRYLRKLRQPEANVVTLGVVVFCLLKDVEDPLARVCAYTGNCKERCYYIVRMVRE